MMNIEKEFVRLKLEEFRRSDYGAREEMFKQLLEEWVKLQGSKSASLFTYPEGMRSPIFDINRTTSTMDC